MDYDLAAMPPEVLGGTSFLIGAVVGGVANLWAIALTSPRDLAAKGENSQAWSSPWFQLVPILGCVVGLGRNRFRGVPLGLRALAVEAATGLLFAAYVLAVVRLQCQHVPEVRPDDFWRSARVVDHLVLLGLLVAATATDLRNYSIPDQITLPGMVFGLSTALLSGQLQVEHIWVDWNLEVPGIRGPYIPVWLDVHRHWHGLAWSFAGAAVGAGMTLFVRGLSGLILGREALGFGDVTLLAMIGSFIGWQPTIVVFVLAPLCGIACIVPLRIVSRKAFLPYGPFLAAATVVVLFSWKWIWQSTRLVFGHPQSLAVLGGAASICLVILLLILRIYKSRFAGPDPGEVRFED